jgi:glutaredoxin
MEFTEPLKTGFTVYTKSGCPNCTKVKKLLHERGLPYEIIDCDEYLIEDRTNFLLFMETKINVIFKAFPIIFNDGVFIGGYQETIYYLDKLLMFEEDF